MGKTATYADNSASETPAALQDGPSKLFVETTTRCNLACAMCPKQAGDDGPESGDFDPSLFAALDSVLPKTESLVLNGIGEPLLHPSLESFITGAKKFLPSSAWVGFQSNGLLLTEDRARSLLDAGLDTLCLSLETVSADLFRDVRIGGDLQMMERAFAALDKAKRALGATAFRTGIEFVVMRDTVRELPNALRWAARRGACYAIVSHLLPYHPSLVPQAAYDTVKDSARVLFAEWTERARAEGLDLGRYRGVYLKYIRSEEDGRLVRFVEAMKAEAVSRGVFLNLDALFSVDEGLLQTVRETFEEAGYVARQEGLDLRLPETVPRSSRRCEFVEEGSVFVSRDGNVQPCYFLWHRCRAYVGGREQHVAPRVFGNLRTRDLGEIWNDPAYRRFRENVLRYDYPFCYNCSFALCDLVQKEPFEQDCYFNAEPCAACLWCMGMFQCLR
jgi:putative metalloenzyme radical SAM/SPASM domain maturase